VTAEPQLAHDGAVLVPKLSGCPAGGLQVLHGSPWNHDLIVFLTGRSLNGLLGNHELEQPLLQAHPHVDATKAQHAMNESSFLGAVFIDSSFEAIFRAFWKS